MLRIDRELLPRFQSLIALALMVLAMSLLSEKFLTSENGWNILRQISVNLCLSIGMTLVILAAGIDLSVGAIASRSCWPFPLPRPRPPRRRMGPDLGTIGLMIRPARRPSDAGAPKSNKIFARRAKWMKAPLP